MRPPARRAFFDFLAQLKQGIDQARLSWNGFVENAGHFGFDFVVLPAFGPVAQVQAADVEGQDQEQPHGSGDERPAVPGKDLDGRELALAQVGPVPGREGGGGQAVRRGCFGGELGQVGLVPGRLRQGHHVQAQGSGQKTTQTRSGRASPGQNDPGRRPGRPAAGGQGPFYFGQNGLPGFGQDFGGPAFVLGQVGFPLQIFRFVQVDVQAFGQGAAQVLTAVKKTTAGPPAGCR